MAKKVYVNGSVLIITSDFKYEGAGAMFDIPEDAETIEPNEVIEGEPFLVIDDERPQSMFYEYYAKRRIYNLIWLVLLFEFKLPNGIRKLY